MKKLIYGQHYLLLAKSSCILLKTGKLERKNNPIFFVGFCFVLLLIIRAFVQQGIKKVHLEPLKIIWGQHTKLIVPILVSL